MEELSMNMLISDMQNEVLKDLAKKNENIEVEIQSPVTYRKKINDIINLDIMNIFKKRIKVSKRLDQKKGNINKMIFYNYEVEFFKILYNQYDGILKSLLKKQEVVVNCNVALKFAKEMESAIKVIPTDEQELYRTIVKDILIKSWLYGGNKQEIINEGVCTDLIETLFNHSK